VYRVQKELIENGNGKAALRFFICNRFQGNRKCFRTVFGRRFRSRNYPKTTQNIQEIILKIMEEKPEITQRELAQIIGITINGIKYHIKKMTNAGIIKHEGPTKSG